MNPEIWRNVFDAIEDPAFLHDAQFCVLRANRAYCRAAGVTEAQALGKPYWEVFPPGTGPLPGCKEAMLGKGDASSREEVSVGAKLFLSKGYPIRDDQSKYLYSLHLLSDITDRKWADAALRENQLRLDLALRSARMGVWYFDIIENRRYFDDQVCRLLGIDPTTFTGAAEEFFGAVHPDDRETIKASLARTLEQDVPYELEFRAVWPDGSVHDIKSRGRLVRDDKGRPATISGIAWDITDRKKSEEGLKLFRALVDQSTDAIEVFDPETLRFLDVNQTACLNLGYSREELLYLNIFDIDPALDRSRSTEIIQQVLKLGSLIIEGRHRRKDGSEFPVEISIGYVQLDRAYMIAVTRDITERKQAEAKLAEQFNELQRWNEAMQGREMRILDLKHEVNELLGQTGQPPRYPSAESDAQKEG